MMTHRSTLGRTAHIAARLLLPGASAMLVAVGVAGCSRGPVVSEGPARAVTLAPVQEARSCVAVAEGFDAADQSHQAIWYYERARELAPATNQWVARRLAPLYDRVGEDDRSAIEYEKAYRLDPNDPVLLNEIGLFELAQGRPVPAARMLRRAVDIEPSLGVAWSNLGLALATQGHYGEAYEAFSQVLTPGEARANLALAMARRADDAAADQEFADAVELQPDLMRYEPVLATIRRERDLAPPSGAPH